MTEASTCDRAEVRVNASAVSTVTTRAFRKVGTTMELPHGDETGRLLFESAIGPN